jgi:hypothetical protein
LALRSATHRAALLLFIPFSASPPPAPLRFDAPPAHSAVYLRTSSQAPAQRPQSACGALDFFIGLFASPWPAPLRLDVSAAHTALQSRPSLRALARRPHRAALAFFNRFFAAPTAALPFDVLGGPQRHCTRARLSALQCDVINAVQASHTHPHIYVPTVPTPESRYYWIFLPLRGAGPPPRTPRASSPKFLR